MPPSDPVTSGVAAATEAGQVQSDRQDSSSPLPPVSDHSVAPYRIDPGHGSPASSGAEAPPGDPLRTQAIQLAEHLLARQQELDRQEAELKTQAADLQAAIHRAQVWFREQQADVEKLREQWLVERRKAEQELQALRDRLEQQRRQDLADLQQKRCAVERRAEEVDRAWVALNQMYEEIGRMHRETLALRLANEELRAQIDARIPPKTRQRMLEQIRAKLWQEYRRASEHLARQKEELLAIQRQLANQYRQLLEQRKQITQAAERGVSIEESTRSGPGIRMYTTAGCPTGPQDASSDWLAISSIRPRQSDR